MQEQLNRLGDGAGAESSDDDSDDEDSDDSDLESDLDDEDAGATSNAVNPLNIGSQYEAVNRPSE